MSGTESRKSLRDFSGPAGLHGALLISLVLFGTPQPTLVSAQEAVRRPAKMLTLGSPAPAFHLPDVVSGERISLETFADKDVLVVMMLCRHCPYVQHVKAGVAQLARDYGKRGVGFVAISSNDASAFPVDAPDSLKEMAAEVGFSFPVLYDETQEAGLAYTAVATPEFFIFDRDRRLVYRGQFDDSRPGNNQPVTGRDVRGALDALLAGQSVLRDQQRAVGCSIKWKPGNEPAYLKR